MDVKIEKRIQADGSARYVVRLASGDMAGELMPHNALFNRPVQFQTIGKTEEWLKDKGYNVVEILVQE